MDVTQTLAENLRWAPAKAVSMADRLTFLRSTKGLWEVIDAIMELWSQTNPKEYESYLIDLDYTKDTGKVYSMAGGKSMSNVSTDLNGAVLRHRLDIPVKVMYMIRRLYSVEECPMDKDFYDKWAKRYPKTVVSEVR